MLYPRRDFFFTSTLDVGLDMIHLVLAIDCFVIYICIYIYTYSSKRIGPAFLFSGMADILFIEYVGDTLKNCMRPVKTQRFPTKNDHVLKCGMIFHWRPDTWAHIALLQSVFLAAAFSEPTTTLLQELGATVKSLAGSVPCPNAGTYTTYPIEKEIIWTIHLHDFGFQPSIFQGAIIFNKPPKVFLLKGWRYNKAYTWGN